ncbi:hypothetical protein V6Z11_A13G058100 [Gossypium hirsutum]|uniref:Uncharacterized protein n=1 Tax=Gossypium tomentosum TaxID=34277 RepID=A0A5D2MGV2_GOSTO|nr:hypothetical protein ES332_A13G060100v1 [Gossypium tomentosum]
MRGCWTETKNEPTLFLDAPKQCGNLNHHSKMSKISSNLSPLVRN